MGTKTTGKRCWHCQKNVMAQKNTPNHVLHLLLTIFTAGLWGIVWLIVTLSNIGGYRCTQCGKAV
jgi:hypothetical protein